tara:strand:- start:134 stop:853 length:720 start_codon:yes stop_codon:yes gene_type:complete
MVTDEHICPFGLKSKDLLERKGFDVIDHSLTTREDADAFKAQHNVETTPQTFIDNERVGGYDELRSYFGKPPAAPQGKTYTPVTSIFAIALVLAIAFAYAVPSGLVVESIFSMRTVEIFVALSMSILAVQKLRDLNSFSNQFITYDLLAKRVVRYAYVYPFAEAFAGIGMIAMLPAILVAPISLFIGTVGAVSVVKAVYIDKRDLKCACAGGDTNVPLGFVSLTENLFMIAAALWMWYR